MSATNVVNPGSVNVAEQSDGEILVNQAITVSPSMNAGPIIQGGDLAPGWGVADTDPSDVTPAMTAQRSIDGGTASPASPNTINTTQNTAISQDVQQFNRTINVFP